MNKGASGNRKANIWMIALLLALLWAVPAPVEALTVTELDFTSGSIALKLGSTTLASTNFTQSGQIVMGQYQPLPNITAPISITVPFVGTYTFSLFTSGPNPTPSASTSGASITADLSALSAWLTGPGLPPTPGLSVNIGGSAIGSFNNLTDAFTGLKWSRTLNSIVGLPGFLQGKTVEFTLNGTAQLAAVPLPAAVLLFGSGLAGLLAARARKSAA
jgi:hypothetical protein